MALVDHAPSRIASTIAQHNLNGKNPGWKAMHHKSRSLVSSARNYNKVEGESLAIYSGVLMNRRVSTAQGDPPLIWWKDTEAGW